MKAILSLARLTFLGVAFSSLLVSQSHSATIYTLPPGGVAAAQSSAYPNGGTTIHSITTPFASASIAGTLSSSVISGDVANPYGGYTFTYLLSLTGGSVDDVSQITVSSFGGFATDVSYNLGGTAPSSFSRSTGAGNVVRFNFIPQTISPGNSSALIVVQTDSLSWANTMAGVINGSTVNVAALAPVAIPEPATAALLLAGIGALVLRRKR